MKERPEVISLLDQIPMADINRHLREEEVDLTRYEVGSKKYNKILDKISLLREIKRRKLKKLV
jgi:hypothetical protein